MPELVALFLVGLALFFHGVAGIRTHLQGLTSRRLRRQLARWARRPLLAGVGGFLFGAITQSSTAVAFILTSLVSGGLMSVAHALPIVAWANLGTVPLVFFASFNSHLAFLYLLGVAGLALAFDAGPPRLRPVIATLFSIGLLFFGLALMKDAFKPLPEFAWFQDFAGFIQGSALVTFVVGAFLRVLVQSSSGIAVITIALAHGGLLSADQAAMMMYGTGAGVGLSIFLLSSNLRGVPRQIAIYQALINGCAGLTLCALYYVEHYSGLPLILALTESLAPSPGLRLACAFLFLQSTAVAVALLASRPAAAWLARLAPPTDEQDLARPRHLSTEALADAESALDLADREQRVLLAHLPALLDTLRPADPAAAPAVPASVRRRAALAVGDEVRAYLRELVEQNLDPDASARLLALEQRQSLITSLTDTVHSFGETYTRLQDSGAAATPAPRLEALLESLDLLVLTALDVAREGDPDDIATLLAITADRGDHMERLRRELLSTDDPSLDHERKSHLFYLTSLFERSVWLLRQFALAQQALARTTSTT